jgi:hypothetical protein
MGISPLPRVTRGHPKTLLSVTSTSHTFAKTSPPLPELCKLIPYSQLKAENESIGDKVRQVAFDAARENAIDSAVESDVDPGQDPTPELLCIDGGVPIYRRKATT